MDSHYTTWMSKDRAFEVAGGRLAQLPHQPLLKSKRLVVRLGEARTTSCYEEDRGELGSVANNANVILIAEERHATQMLR